MLTFEEFHASRNRQRATNNAEQTSKTNHTQHVKDDDDDDDNNTESSSHSVKKTQNNDTDLRFLLPKTQTHGSAKSSLGEITESYDVQIVILSLMYFDFLASALKLLLSCRYNVDNDYEDDDDHPMTRVFRMLRSFTAFTIMIFILEIGIILIAFRYRVFSHWGYLLDIFLLLVPILVSMFVSPSQTNNHDDIDVFECRIFHFLRFPWRLARLIHTGSETTRSRYDETQHRLQRETSKRKRLSRDLQSVEKRLEDEIELRTQAEEMIRGYKDEVDTLNEALNIAALDVAGVAQEEIRRMEKGDGSDVEEKEEEDEEESVVEGEKFVDDDGDEFFDGGEGGESNPMVTFDDGIVDDNHT